MKNKITPGSLCYFREHIVLVIKELYDMEKINTPCYNNVSSYYVLFLNGIVDTVSVNALKKII